MVTPAGVIYLLGGIVLVALVFFSCRPSFRGNLRTSGVDRTMAAQCATSLLGGIAFGDDVRRGPVVKGGFSARCSFASFVALTTVLS